MLACVFELCPALMYSLTTAISYILHRNHNYGRKWENITFTCGSMKWCILYSADRIWLFSLNDKTHTPHERANFGHNFLILVIHL